MKAFFDDVIKAIRTPLSPLSSRGGLGLQTKSGMGMGHGERYMSRRRPMIRADQQATGHCPNAYGPVRHCHKGLSRDRGMFCKVAWPMIHSY